MKQSAGILVFRRRSRIEVFLVHPDGPFWGKKDFWSIPKGELHDSEDYLSAARREFVEETGLNPPEGKTIELGWSKQSSKTDYIWAVEGDVDLAKFKCVSIVKLEWPPKSGQIMEFPEVDRARWFDLATAKKKVFKSQAVFIDRLAEELKAVIPPEPEQIKLI